MQSAKFREDGSIKEYSEYRRDAGQIAEIQNETWFRVENEMFNRQMVQAEDWDRIVADKDLWPYWTWRGRMDKRERPEHEEMEGKTFRVGDKRADACLPPGDWNCRCDAETQDEDTVKSQGLKVVTDDEAGELLNTHINEQFRYNPAEQGMMPKSHHSYFDVLPNANAANSSTFEMPAPNGKKLDGLTAKGLHAALELWNEWQRKYHTDKHGNIIFQHNSSLANIAFTAQGIHKIAKHPKGMDNIPSVLRRPDEMWQQWADKSQQVVQRHYILFGPVCYVAITVAGVLQDAFAVSKSSIDNYRKGIPFLI